MSLFKFGSDSKTSNTTNNSIDNSVDDHSTNTNNAGAFQVSGSYDYTDSSTNNAGAFQVGGDYNVTDGGAFDVAKQALASNQGVLDSALDTVGETVGMAGQLTRQSIDHSLAIAGQASRSESKELMSTITKVGLALAAVIGVGMIAGRRK